MIEPKLYMNALLMGCLLHRWYFDVDRISKMTATVGLSYEQSTR